MTMTQSVGRLGATLVAMLQTRLELGAVEVEEASLRFVRHVLLALLALFLLGIAIVLIAFFVIIVFWDSHRIEAVLGMATLFALLGAAIGVKLRASLREGPRLLSFTVAELNKDIAFIKSATRSHER